MRIVCDQCQTTYIISDDKDLKSTIRITCQKCGNVFTAKTAENSAELDPETAPVLEKWKNTAESAPKRPKGEIAGWYYSYNGQSYGPYTETQLLEKFESSEANLNSFVWNARLIEWKPAAQVEPFASICEASMLPPPPPPPQFAASTNADMPPLFHPTSGNFKAVDKTSENDPLKESINPEQKENSKISLPSSIQKAKTASSLNKIAPSPLKGSSTLGLPSIQKLKTTSSITPTTNSAKPLGLKSVTGLPSFKSGLNRNSLLHNNKDENLSNKTNLLPSSGVSSVAAALKTKKQESSDESAVSTNSKLSTGTSEKKEKQSSGTLDIGLLKKKLEETPSTVIPKIDDEKLESPEINPDAQTALDLNRPKSDNLASVTPVEPKSIDLSADNSTSSDLPRTNSSNISNITVPANPSLELPVLSTEVPTVAPKKPELPSFAKLEIALDEEEDSELISREEIHKATSDLVIALEEDEASELIPHEKVQEAVQNAKNDNLTKPPIPSASSLAVIDLDDEDSRFYEKPSLEELKPIPELHNDGILDAENDSLSSLKNENSNSTAKVAKTIKKQQKSEDMFDAFQSNQNNDQNDDDDDREKLSENSMVIQLEHLQRQERKSKMRSFFYLLIALGVILAVAITAYFLSGKNTAGVTISTLQNNKQLYERVEGMEISEEDLNRMAPEEEFFIVAEVKTKNTNSNKSKNSAKTKTNDSNHAEKLAENTKNIETTEESNKPTAIPGISGIKRDAIELQVPAPNESLTGADANIKASKYADVDLRKPQSNEKSMLASGRTIVAKTIKDCFQRLRKTENIDASKVKVSIVVNPAGKVESYQLDNVPSEKFRSCIESKKDLWIFEPREGGDNLKFSQTFTLN